jgi:nicotinamidase-related amidase
MKRLLVVVDFQNDFVDGALGFPSAGSDATEAGRAKNRRVELVAK